MPIARSLGVYEVSNLGSVRRVQTGKVRKPHYEKRGYAIVDLYDHGLIGWFSVHRLVALAFLGEPANEAMQVNHRDGNKSNNAVSNLEWVTGSENIRHKFDVLGVQPKRSKWRVIGPDGVVLHLDGLRQFCRKNGLSQGDMSLVASGAASHHKGWRCEKLAA